MYSKVREVFIADKNAQIAQVEFELREKESKYKADGVNPESVPKIQELHFKLAQYKSDAIEHENIVFSHLLTFFSRYYDKGDFISQRRYKGETYAIPYAGEEVMLHWANKDQYYTKSSESFSNYGFKLDDGRSVNFHLVAADTAKDNRKDNDKDRRFVLATPQTVTRIDDDGEEYEENILPIEELTDIDGNVALTIRFEYKAMPKNTKQDVLVINAANTVLGDEIVSNRWLALGSRAPTEKNPQRTLLEKHLTDYTIKNTADYFIHKDLGGFLRRELDFYIKNEVMHLDDVQNASTFANIEKSLRMIQCLRVVALELISFLAQLEDFQKKLWLKKKFVVSSHYCITIDRVPEALYIEIAANEKQWVQWHQLGVWENKSVGTLEDLKAAPYRMVDTSLFGKTFKAKLLQAIDDLDEQTDGLLIHSENFQALQLMQKRYREKIKCIYMDPPYNTEEDRKHGRFLYKDGFSSSSWMSLIAQTLDVQSELSSKQGVFFCSIDDNQKSNLTTLIKSKYGSANLLADMIVLTGANQSGTGVKIQTNTENCISFCLDVNHVEIIHVDPVAEELRNLNDAPTPLSTREDMGYSIYYNKETKHCIPMMDYDKSKIPSNSEEEVYNNDLDLISQGYVPIRPGMRNGLLHRWRWGLEGFKKRLDEVVVVDGKNGYSVKFKQKGFNAPKNIMNFSTGTTELNNLFNEFSGFVYPKSTEFIKRLLSIGTYSNSIVLDCFGGSGSTGHAVINLNRKDKSNRKYILVEQGDYFNIVLKPRIQKVVYSADWKEGKPTAPETGISHCFKVLKLESYEDTLNNLQLVRTNEQGVLLKNLSKQAQEDYLLHYMLDVESRGSLLSVDDFNKPFDYEMNIATDSAGAYESKKIDLVETFNYLIGLKVKQIDAQVERGYLTVIGTLPNGESCLVLWRDCDVLDYEGVSKLCDRLAINPADSEFDVVYINGDHNIPTVLTQTADEGGATRLLKLRQIEPEFLECMFSMEDV